MECESAQWIWLEGTLNHESGEHNEFASPCWKIFFAEHAWLSDAFDPSAPTNCRSHIWNASATRRRGARQSTRLRLRDWDMENSPDSPPTSSNGLHRLDRL